MRSRINRGKTFGSHTYDPASITFLLVGMITKIAETEDVAKCRGSGRKRKEYGQHAAKSQQANSGSPEDSLVSQVYWGGRYRILQATH